MSEKADEFWLAASIHRDTMVAKLNLLRDWNDVAAKLDECRRSITNVNCQNCERFRTFRNRCDRKYCPLCTPRLSWLRREKILFAVAKFHQPKHVVLTQRNTADLTKAHVKKHKANIVLLRRAKFAENWLGGFQNTELTNEGAGWHLHTHLLVEARWICAKELAITWANIVGQEFAIVKVKDARGASYLAELTKYVCKGSQVAGWTPEKIAQMILAFDRVRTWHCFGLLNGLDKEWKRYQAECRAPYRCECGSSSWKVNVQYDPHPFHA